VNLELREDALDFIATISDGDARRALNALEVAALSGKPGADGRVVFDLDLAAESIQRKAIVYDRGDDEHYDTASAFIKSMRGSDPDATIYWLAKMLEAGEDPEFIARRIIIQAAEDIGLADPQAQAICLGAWEAYERLGSPEGELALAQAVTYLALAPKSNAGYVAYKAARASAKQTGSEPPPKHILNAPTTLMKKAGYGTGYQYDHDTAEGFSGQDYFPDEMERRQFYDAPERGFEREIRERLEYWAKLRRKGHQADQT